MVKYRLGCYLKNRLEEASIWSWERSRLIIICDNLRMRCWWLGYSGCSGDEDTWTNSWSVFEGERIGINHMWGRGEFVRSGKWGIFFFFTKVEKQIWGVCTYITVGGTHSGCQGGN